MIIVSKCEMNHRMYVSYNSVFTRVSQRVTRKSLWDFPPGAFFPGVRRVLPAFATFLTHFWPRAGGLCFLKVFFRVQSGSYATEVFFAKIR